MAAGHLRTLAVHPRIELEPAVVYRPDFSYEDTATGRTYWEEVKGAEDARFRLIRRLWRLHGPGPLRILKATRADAPWTEEWITPIRI